MANTLHVTARLPSDLVARLQAHADRTDRTLTATMRRLLQTAIDRAEREERIAAMSDEEIDAFLLGRGIDAPPNDRQEPGAAPVGSATAEQDGEARREA